MKIALQNFYRDHKQGMFFIILLLTSFFLSAASHRIIFYVLAPYMAFTLYQQRNELGPLFKTKSFLILCGYLSYFSLSFFWSIDTDVETFLKVLRDVAGILLFSLTMAFAIPKISFSPKTPVYFALACLLFAVASALVHYSVESREISYRMAALGRYENSIYFSILMCFAVLSLLALEFKGGWRDVSLRIILVALLLLFVGLSQTRSTLVALVGCIVFLAFLGRPKNALILSAVFVPCVALVFFLWDFSFMGMFSRLDAFRLTIWSEAIEGIKAHPWLGHGISTEPKFALEIPNSEGGWKSTHNVFLGHQYTGGVPGLIIYILMIFNMSWVLLKRWLKERANKSLSYVLVFTALIFCFSMIMSLFVFTHYITNLHIHWLIFWTPFAIIWSMEAASREKTVK
jgi:O-antigen ligase